MEDEGSTCLTPTSSLRTGAVQTARPQAAWPTFTPHSPLLRHPLRQRPCGLSPPITPAWVTGLPGTWEMLNVHQGTPISSVRPKAKLRPPPPAMSATPGLKARHLLLTPQPCCPRVSKYLPLHKRAGLRSQMFQRYERRALVICRKREGIPMTRYVSRSKK